MDPVSITTPRAAAPMPHSSVDENEARSSAPETKRIKELFKYFLAASHATGFANGDTESPVDTLRLASDPVLNALTQLAACRLSCDRAFVSLIDGHHQHVIAEVTREISLYETSLHPPGHGICIGTKSLDLDFGVCAGTIPAFIDGPLNGPMIDTANIYADRTQYVIRDFTLEDMYKNRPYVTGFPFMRYYAEVPIRTNTDYVIGTLAVIHSEPLGWLDEAKFRALTEISAAIMRHLEMVKQSHEQAQASRLLQGLNNFVQWDNSGDTRLEDGLDETTANGTGIIGKEESPSKATNLDQKRKSTVLSGENELHSSSSPPSLFSPPYALPGAVTPSESVPPVILEDDALQAQSPSDQMEPVNSCSLDSGSDQLQEAPELRHSTKLRDIVVSEEVQATFSRASHILRNAMDLDGVIFLDASVSYFGSRRDAAYEYDSSDGIDVYDAPPRGSEHLPLLERKTLQSTLDPQHKMSARLGFSTSKLSNVSNNVISAQRYSLPEVLIQSLLRRFPHGHIFDFSQENNRQFRRRRSSLENLGSKSKQRMRIMKKSMIYDVIRDSFPDACSIVFTPLWSHHKQAWFAGSIGWTNTEKKVFQKEEFAYFSVFANSIMAEIARLDLAASDRAKSDFISSVSHELRSPLHGILGSSELLRESPLDASQEQMVSMVENCGRTLLDTMDHILDFAKLSKGPQNKADDNQANLSSGVQSAFRLDEVLEDTIESLLTGHHYDLESKRKFKDHSQTNNQPIELESKIKSPVLVVLDIDRLSVGEVQSDIAAWRRIVLNILGNALKYTNKGLIEVILRSVSTPGSEKLEPVHRMTTLTIRDTGCGIGKAYLQSHLFTPFAQENSLSQGTGLGLSIVQKLVHGLYGTLNVQSEVGVGTQVTISIPLKVFSTTEIAKVHYPNATLCLLGFDTSSDSRSTPTGTLPATPKVGISLKSAIATYAQDWLGIDVVSASRAEQNLANVIVVSEDNLHLLESEDGKGSKKSLLRHGSSLLVLSASGTGSNWGHNSGRIQFIAQPYGPRKVVAALKLALEADRGEDIWNIDGRLLPVTRKPSASTGSEEKVKLSAIQMGAGAQTMQKKQDTTSTANVLLVDDNDVNLSILAAQMRKLGCEYTTAMNGQEAVDAYRSSARPFDYVLMDVSMPIMDGFTATRAIRDFEMSVSRPATIVVALTGLGSAGAKQEGFTSGMNLFLTKPVPMKTVKLLVERGVEALQQT